MNNRPFNLSDDQHLQLTIQQDISAANQLSNEDWITLLDAKFLLSSLNNIDKKEKHIIYQELGLEITLLDDIQSLYNKVLKGKNADRNQEILSNVFNTLSINDLIPLKEFCDRAILSSDLNNIKEGFIQETSYARSPGFANLNYKLCTFAIGVTCAFNEKKQLEENNQGASSIVSTTGELKTTFNSTQLKENVTKARAFIKNRQLPSQSIFHNIFNNNYRSSSLVAMIFSFPSKGSLLEKTVAVILSPLSLIKNIIKIPAELLTAYLLDFSITTCSETFFNVLSPCWSYLKHPQSTLGGSIAAAFILLFSSTIVLTSAIVAIAAGIVTNVASLLLSPSDMSRRAEKTGYFIGKKMGLSNNGAENLATAFYYTSKILTVAAYVAIGFLTAGIAPAIAKAGAIGDWAVKAANSMGSLFTNLFSFFSTAAAPIGITIAAGSTVIDKIQNHALATDENKIFKVTPVKKQSPFLSTTAAIQRNDKLNLVPAPFHQPTHVLASSLAQPAQLDRSAEYKAENFVMDSESSVPLALNETQYRIN